MAKIFLEQTGKIAVYRGKESPKGEPETENGVTMDMDSGSGMSLERLIEDDRDLIKGVEAPANIFYSSHTAAGKLAQKRAKPDFIAFVLAHFFGTCESTSVGTSAYMHAISPLDDLDHPGFTLVQRRGNSIFKERYSANHVDGFSLELGETWAGMSADIKGWGKRDVNYEHEVVTAAANSTQITLAENAVQGADAEERLENVFRVRAKDYGDDHWTVAEVDAVSADTPAVISLAEAVGTSSENIDFNVDYIPEEPGWCTLPDSVDESPLRLVDASIILDGYYNGETLLGGEVVSSGVLNFSISGANDMQIRHVPDSSGAQHAGESLRGGRIATIRLSEKLRDTVRQYQLDHAESECLAVCLELKGAEIDPGSGIYFGAKIIFPKCGILNAPVTVSGRYLAQEGDLLVLDDGTYKGAVIKCWNRQESYL